MNVIDPVAPKYVVGFGDFEPTKTSTRILLFPLALIGIAQLGSILSLINSLSSLLFGCFFLFPLSVLWITPSPDPVGSVFYLGIQRFSPSRSICLQPEPKLRQG